MGGGHRERGSPRGTSPPEQEIAHASLPEQLLQGAEAGPVHVHVRVAEEGVLQARARPSPR